MLIRQIQSKLSKYSQSIGWILIDLCQQFKVSWLVASVVSVISPTLQAVAFALLTSFIVASAKNTKVSIDYLLPLSLDANKAPSILLVSFLCTGLLFSSALSKYIGDKLFVNLRFSYTRFNLKRGIKQIIDNGVGSDKNNRQASDRLAVFVKRDSVACGKIAYVAASAAAPLFEFVIFGAIALFLYPLLTIIIALGALLTLRIFRKIISSGIYYSSVRESYSLKSSHELRDYVSQAKIDTSHEVDLLQSLSLYLPNTSSWLDILSGFVLVVPKSRFIASSISSLVVGFIIVFLASQFYSDDGSISVSLFYLISLRYIIRSVQQLASRFSSLNRFYFQARRYKNMMLGEFPNRVVNNLSVDEEDEEDEV